jgi:hypothetical protein
MKIIRQAMLVTLILSTSGNVSCDKCNDTDAPITKPIYLKFVDEEGKNLVNATNGPYFIDTLKAMSETNERVVLRKKNNFDVSDPTFELVPNFNDAGHLIALIYFNKQDLDTLDITYKKMDNDCALIYEWGEFKYNGKSIGVNGLDNIFYVRK